MIKNSLFLFLLLPLFCFPQKRFVENSKVSFFSYAPLEDITAVSNKLEGVVDFDTGDFFFRIPITSFIFPSSLMQKHFNEKYMESEKYPKSTFSGKIDDWQNINLKEGKKVDVTVEGVIEIHGVKKVITANGTLQLKNGSINLRSKFS